MKKTAIFSAVIALSLFLISWGMTGHRTIGKIAENHLTPKAQAAVHDLLGEQSLADVSTWADEVRGQAAYRQTASWHFLNLSLGLTYPEFEKQVQGMGPDNVYGALIRCEQDLIYSGTPREKKIEDLKFIVHFVGDLHQPMHISRAEDKGGNTIQLNYEGQGTNLHAVWDTKLLEHKGLIYGQLAEKYDHLSAAQIKQWQSDPLLTWIWESYQISSKLYTEVDTMKGRTIDNSYYEAHIGIIQERIEKAGIRLAGVLNEIFKEGSINGAIIPPPGMATVVDIKRIMVVTASDVANHLNANVQTSGTIISTRLISSNNMTLLNINGDNPNQDFTIVIKSEDRSKFGQPEIDLKGKIVTVTGIVMDYKGKPEIFISDTSQIKVQ